MEAVRYSPYDTWTDKRSELVTDNIAFRHISVMVIGSRTENEEPASVILHIDGEKIRLADDKARDFLKAYDRWLKFSSHSIQIP